MSLTSGMLLAQRYRVDRPLGSGGMGTVFGGWDRLEQLLCAIKYVPDLDAATMQQVKLEAELLQKLRSPHVPRFLAHLTAISIPGQVLVMEYIEGEDLEGRVAAAGRLNEAIALNYALQILEALMHLHAQRPPIIHRDVKPANIRIDRYNNAWLLDLGIGQRAGMMVAPAHRPFRSRTRRRSSGKLVPRMNAAMCTRWARPCITC